ncbi:MAG TPA: hypothetical protein VHB98_08990 [Chloroflexota bacterium]|jgi:hypothetical protein|nr:hypothetical protein [Chloroflexota bacterium]
MQAERTNLGTYFVAYLSWITYADSYCNNGGLYLDFPWILPVVPIVERTC